jgi:CRP-like cAMP-binding protein
MSAATKAIARPEPLAATIEWQKELIRAVGLFADLRDDDRALDALSRLMRHRIFPSGSAIIQEGTEGTELYILIKGEAAVFKSTPGGDEYKVAILPAATRPAFGEGGLVDSDRRTASIRAALDCECLALGREDFERFSIEHPQWALPVYRRIATGVMSRLRKTNDDMLLLYNALVAEIRGR